MRSLAFAIRQLLRRPLLRAGLGLGGLLPMAALANPSGGQVVGGTATINAPDADHTVIDQQSQQAIINWQQFSVGSKQYVQFRQPDSSAVVLNRVVGGDPSNILGSVKANGQVFLVNPNGVFFGASASLDVQGLVATTQGISNSDFMAGHYVFTKGANAPDGSVTNAGDITAKAGGYVVLAGDYAANSGVITAQTGHIVLASGTQTTLTLSGNSLVGFAVNQATLSSLAGVNNAGKLSADGGQLVMTADVANQLKATVVNNTGLVEAHSITSHNGSVVLSAKGGNIENSGTLDASALVSGVAGGSIVVKGNAATDLTSTSKVIATGDNAKGGFIEISGHAIKVRGLTRAGRGGTILIDPAKLVIQAGGAGFHSTGGTGTSGIGTGYIASHLSNGTNMTLTASNAISASNLATSIHSVGGSPTYGALTLNAGAGGIKLGGLKINIRGGLTVSASGNSSFGSVTASAGVSIQGGTVTAGNITATGGSVTVKASTGAVKTGSVTANAGITVQGGTVTVGNITATGGNVAVNAGTGKATLQSVKAAKGYIHVNGHGVVATGTLSAGASGAGGSISIGAGTGAASLNKETALTNVTIKGTGVTGTGLLTANAVTVSAGTGAIGLVTKTGSLTLNSGANVNINDKAETGAATLAFGGGTFGDITADFGGNVSLTSGVTGNSLNLYTPGNVVGGTYIYKLGSIWIKAGGKIDFSNAQLTLGSSVNPNATGDTKVTDLLASYSLAPSSLVPNSVFTAGAGQSISFGTLDFAGSYLRLNADALAFNGQVTVPTTSVVQMAPVSTAADISVEQTLSTAAPVNFGAASELTLFPTVVIGGGTESGNVTIGQNGPLSLNNTNLFIVTTGSISGLNTVRTTGIVGELPTATSGSPAFELPTAQEVGGTGASVNTTGFPSSQNYPATTGQQALQQIYASPFGAPCLIVVASGNQGYTCVQSKPDQTPG